MNIFSRYIAYLKDNPEGYWFKRKLYGWGWTPATKEGWATVIIFFSIFFAIVSRVDPEASGEVVLKEVLGPVFVLALLLIVISWKTGEPPKWTFGFPNEKDTNEKANTTPSSNSSDKTS